MPSNLQIFNSELEKFLENTKNLWERIENINRAIQDPRLLPQFEDHACQKCGSTRFSYDSHFKEIACENCCWVVPFNMAALEAPQSGEYDFVVWETSALAKAALMPMVQSFSGYGAIIDSNLEKTWDLLMTVAMTGAAMHADGTLYNPRVQAEIKKALSNQGQIGADLFDDYYGYTIERTLETKAPWCGVSALWVADKLRLSDGATSELKRNTQQLDFANKLSTFLSVSFGSTEEGFSYYLCYMALDVEKNMGIDMGLGTKGTKKDPQKKVSIIAHIFESFAQNTVELIAEGSSKQVKEL